MKIPQAHASHCRLGFHCVFLFVFAAAAYGQSLESGNALKVSVEPDHGIFSLSGAGSASLKQSSTAIEVDRKWLKVADYPRPNIAKTSETGEFGPADCMTVTYPGDSTRPELVYRLRAYTGSPFADLQVTVRNTTSRPISIQDIRPIEISSPDGIALGGPNEDDRVLSDSMSEDRPTMSIRDFADGPKGTHRAAGSQLFYNRKSGIGFFIGALTSDKFLTVFKAHVAPASGSRALASYQVDDTGMTEYVKEWSLKGAPATDQIELSVTVAPGEELKSERLLLSFDTDCHRQLEAYAHMIRDLHHARVTAPTPMGWWSWTAYYAKLDEATALHDAQWLAQNLKPLGYTFFHIDEGYAIGRGDYLTADAKLFPNGMEPVEKKIASLGLTPAIWTAPFEVSEHSWIYKNHPEWLVKNSEGKPIALPGATPPNPGRIFSLDPTHPGAQDYLKKTYGTMANQWGIRYFKLDFMEDSAVEGEHYRPNTSALEAQRIGLEVIRAAVGDRVWLDKDGSPMLNPVGLVDMGRISQDTGHNYRALKETATGIAARYYMNRNWFIADPDAFMVTEGSGKNSLSLDEAKVSIALSLVSGGMFEIGNKLPDFDSQPDRLALIKNPMVIEMAKRGEASKPIDLMSYSPEDGQPSIFFLKADEDSRASILTVFNWTDKERTQSVGGELLGLQTGSTYAVKDVFSGVDRPACHECSFDLKLAPHSVQMLMIRGPQSPDAR